jgi:hypothetical protein
MSFSETARTFRCRGGQYIASKVEKVWRMEERSVLILKSGTMTVLSVRKMVRLGDSQMGAEEWD